MKHILLIVLGVIAAAPYYASAGPIIRSGESVSIDASQSLEGDFYALASSVIISGSAKEDVYAIGGDVIVNGETAKDLSIAGGSVQVHGTVGDDLRVVGGEVTIADPVKGDVVVIGGTLTILSTASVGGDVIFWGGKLVVEGAVAGAIHGGSEELRIDAAVGKGVEYTAARSFVLGDNARITGDVVYTSFNEVIRAQGSVAENVRHIEKTSESNTDAARSYLLFGITIIFSALVCYFLARGLTARIAEGSVSMLGMSGLIGLGVLILMPVIAIVLMVSVVGSILGVFLLFGYAAVLFLALILTPFIWGMHVQRILRKTECTVYTAVLGGTLLMAIFLVPVLGPFFAFAGLMVSLGLLSHTLYHSVRD